MPLAWSLKTQSLAVLAQVVILVLPEFVTFQSVSPLPSSALESVAPTLKVPLVLVSVLSITRKYLVLASRVAFGGALKMFIPDAKVAWLVRV